MNEIHPAETPAPAQTIHPSGISGGNVGNAREELLKSASPSELKALIAEANAKLAESEAKHREDSRKRVTDLATSLGYDIYELLGVQKPGATKASRSARSADEAKPMAAGALRDPETGKVWPGRGRRPAWFGRGVPV